VEAADADGVIAEAVKTLGAPYPKKLIAVRR
jgi:hypothetical protein